jgi:hypothetical protein
MRSIAPLVRRLGGSNPPSSFGAGGIRPLVACIVQAPDGPPPSPAAAIHDGFSR